MDGFLCIDKPKGPSSFAIVAQVRNVLGAKKIGHCGTLDPAATGLLVIAIGKAPKLLPFLDLNPKKYVFSVKFGTQTDTLDSQGAETVTGGRMPDAAEIERVLPEFTGEIDQVPPSFSAVKIGGVRAYRMARKKRAVQLKSKKVTIPVIMQYIIQARCCRPFVFSVDSTGMCPNSCSVYYMTHIHFFFRLPI